MDGEIQITNGSLKRDQNRPTDYAYQINTRILGVLKLAFCDLKKI